jgi:dGTPase
MRPFGGFDHNAQSVRVVASLERKYLAFDGLNLTWEMLEGLVKHNGPVQNRDHAVAKAVRRIELWQSLELDNWASAEAQAASLADDIAYLSHDVDDGLRAHLLSFETLEGAALAGPIAAEVAAIAPSTSDGRAIYEVTRRMITAMVADVVTQSRHRLRTLAPQGPDDIRRAPEAVVAFSPPMARDLTLLKEFLFAHVYRHPKVMGVMAGAESIVMDLFERYLSDPGNMPEAWGRTAHALGSRRRARLVADFVSGQTDRYAIAEHRRLFTATPELR